MAAKRTTKSPSQSPRANAAAAPAAPALPDRFYGTAMDPVAAPVAAPGTLPPTTIQFKIPDVVRKHYIELFPEEGPQPHESAPGVFINPDGSTYMPRQREGGQFSALLLVVQGRFTQKRRQIGLPLVANDNPQNWPLNRKAQEHVVERYEVVFDFEDELQAFLDAFGTANGDPLAQRLQRTAGVDPRMYDAENLQPKPRFTNAL